MRKIKDPVKLVFEFILVGILFFIFYIALSYHNFYEKRGLNKKEIIKKIAKDRNVSKNEIYQYFI